jgi:hypothetical protein
MAIYTANRPTKTLTLHKDHCRVVSKDRGLEPCGCGKTGEHENQQWWCEQHITIDEVNELMNRKFWAILLCDTCYRSE